MLKTKIKNKEKTIGMHLNLSDVTVGRIAGLAGYDFIWIDMEHGYLSYEALLQLILAVKSGGSQVIVRVPQDDLTATKKVMEMGVDGIIFPMVKTAEEANRLISYTLYPPYGIRGFGPMNAIDYGFKDVGEYVSTNHKNMCRFVQVEHIDAVKNLDAIMQNEFIDGYIIGANDLSGSIGRLGDVFGEETTSLIKEAVSKLKANGKYVGLSTGDTSYKTTCHWKEMGIDMLSSGTDFDFLTAAVKENKEKLLKFYI